jgi:hypothetical protein
MAVLTEAMHTDAAQHQSQLREALAVLTAEGRATHAPVELLVGALRTATTCTNGIDASELSARYGAALVQLLALYFEEDAE